MTAGGERRLQLPPPPPPLLLPTLAGLEPSSQLLALPLPPRPCLAMLIMPSTYMHKLSCGPRRKARSRLGTLVLHKSHLQLP